MLQVAYYSHEKEIKDYIKRQKAELVTEKRKASKNGTFKSCSCCFDNEVLPRDVSMCNLGCVFCKSCVIQSSEVHFSEGKFQFPCLANCSSFFSRDTLKAVLSPKLFSKIAQKRATEKLKQAGVVGLEFCQFCDFATVPDEESPVFRCFNLGCMIESCRLCKEKSHIPLRCDQVEQDEDTRARIFVENKMTDALLRFVLLIFVFTEFPAINYDLR